MTSSIASSRQTNTGWIVIDARDAVLGRLASFVARRLRGKHRADYTPHVDTGDNVIVINAEKIHLTGRKTSQKIWYRHTGYPGGIKATRAEEILAGRHPERLITLAVKRMLPKESSLARQQFAKLRVYPGSDHPHHAQKPQTIDFLPRNRKNARHEQKTSRLVQQ